MPTHTAFIIEMITQITFLYYGYNVDNTRTNYGRWLFIFNMYLYTYR